MDYLNEHQQILALAAAGKLPDRIEEGGAVPVAVFRELFEQGLVDAADASSKDGLEYLEPRITIAGREYLNTLEARTFAASPLGRVQKAGLLVGGWLAGIGTAVAADLIKAALQ
jgi:hypothetical protein